MAECTRRTRAYVESYGGSGLPLYCYDDQSLIYFAPTPDSAYSIRINQMQRPPTAGYPQLIGAVASVRFGTLTSNLTAATFRPCVRAARASRRKFNVASKTSGVWFDS